MNLLIKFNAIFFVIALFYPLIVTAKEARERSDIPEEYKWNLSSMYTNKVAWKKDFDLASKRISGLEKFRGSLKNSGEDLLTAIQAKESISQLVGNLYVYAGLKSNEDTRIGDNAARFSEAQTLYAHYQEATSFYTPEILAIPDKKLEHMLSETRELEIYRHFFNELKRMTSYTLSESEEKLLAMASDPLGRFQGVFSALDNADLELPKIRDENEEEVQLTQARYGAYLRSEVRSVRESAWKNLFIAYEKLGNTLAANYEGHVKSQVFLAKARGFDSALQAATYSNAIPEAVYTNLVQTVQEGAKPLQRYLELRRKMLKVDRLEIWDLYAPMISPSINNISFTKAKTLVAEALAPLGDDYLALYWKGFDEGWVDAFENQGKRSGAYSWGTYSSKPYLSMNYEGTLGDVSTLAHEYGHSLHSYLTRKNQPYVYGDYRTFIAEVASMTNEAILMQKMLSEANSPKEKAYLLQSYLDEFRGGFYRQTSFADFEMQTHALVESGGALTKDNLNNLYASIFDKYYGNAVYADSLNASEWSRIPHFLRTDNFYVYQYATSFAAATALAKNILKGGEEARKTFLDLLKSGNSDYPIELLKKAGVDMTTPQPIYDTIETFSNLVDELENILSSLEG
ncbi:MAG: oligoendopeptidase F [Halieaceae bacterium]|nr:oligoendopeptidase F [Halieaceae bacterium]